MSSEHNTNKCERTFNVCEEMSVHYIGGGNNQNVIGAATCHQFIGLSGLDFTISSPLEPGILVSNCYTLGALRSSRLTRVFPTDGERGIVTTCAQRPPKPLGIYGTMRGHPQLRSRTLTSNTSGRLSRRVKCLLSLGV
jgi:hypothetical protein